MNGDAVFCSVLLTVLSSCLLGGVIALIFDGFIVIVAYVLGAGIGLFVAGCCQVAGACSAEERNRYGPHNV